jgi:uncharacterized protein (DUF2384 family)
MADDVSNGDDWYVDQLFAFAEKVFASKEKAEEWMRTKIVALRNARPINLLATPEGRKWVGDVQAKIDEGFP